MHDPVLKYGAHSGKRVSELPEDYVMWWADRPDALKENHIAKAICARASELASKYIGDYQSGCSMYTCYDPDPDQW